MNEEAYKKLMSELDILLNVRLKLDEISIQKYEALSKITPLNVKYEKILNDIDSIDGLFDDINNKINNVLNGLKEVIENE